MFFIFAEKGAYFSYQVSVNARASAQEAWNTSFVDEFHYHLGAPLGPPTKDGYVYERSYENVDVWVNLVTKEAVLDWKDKTKITTTSCSDVITDVNNTTTSQLEIYPNPTSGIIHLTDASTPYQVFDALGQVIISSNSPSFDLSNHPSGLYLIKMDNRIVRIIKE